jgi:hypothetical protein
VSPKYKPKEVSLKAALWGTLYGSVDGYPEEDVGFSFRMFLPLIPARYIFVRTLHFAENKL